MPSRIDGRRFSYWLADTLKHEREGQGIPISTVASVLDVSARTLERFEDVSEPEGKGYGQDVDRYVAGYAYVLGVDDPRQLWQRALDRWMTKGSPPDFMDDLPGARFIRPIRDESRRRTSAPVERQGKPVAKKNLREAR